MRFYFLLCLFFCLSAPLFSQNDAFTGPDHFLIGDRQVPQVLLVGSWHFNYPGMDAHVSRKEDRMDILSDKRQEELKELLDYIAKFRPTKIVVEGGRNSGYLMWNYRDWKSGERPLGRSEVEQIGIRLLDRFQLDTLYGADSYSLLLELYDQRDTLQEPGYLEKITERHYFGGDDPIMKRFIEWYHYENKQTVTHSLLESFLYLNSDKVLDRGFGAYISGGQFDSENYEGADALSMFWFNRNLRIFRNIQNIESSPDDRILVLFGAGHVSILKYLFECSPQYDLVKFNELNELLLRHSKGVN